jgi:hypothetical protein
MFVELGASLVTDCGQRLVEGKFVILRLSAQHKSWVPLEVEMEEPHLVVMVLYEATVNYATQGIPQEQHFSADLDF